MKQMNERHYRVIERKLLAEERALYFFFEICAGDARMLPVISIRA